MPAVVSAKEPSSTLSNRHALIYGDGPRFDIYSWYTGALLQVSVVALNDGEVVDRSTPVGRKGSRSNGKA